MNPLDGHGGAAELEAFTDAGAACARIAEIYERSRAAIRTAFQEPADGLVGVEIVRDRRQTPADLLQEVHRHGGVATTRFLVGRNADKIERLAKEFGVERWTTDLDRALDNKDDAIFFDAATTQALEDTMLSPHFYTTDFAAIDRLDVSSIRPQWDALMQEFRDDANRGHFQRPADLDADYSKLPPELNALPAPRMMATFF